MALASLRPLRSRNFALIWSAALVSNVGSWMQTVALGVLVFSRTNQPGWTTLVVAAGFLPIGLLAPLGGALADRLDRRKWLILTTLAEMTFAAILAVLAGAHHDPPGVLLLLSFLGGAAGAVGFPAYQAMVPDLVPTEDLLGAVSLSSAQFNLGRVIGPALAGVALLSQDYALVFGINAASFAAVVALLASPFIALVAAMSGAIHHRGVTNETTTAVLVTAQGIGAVAGALLLPSLAERVGRRTMLTAALFVLPVLLAGYGLASSLLWSAIAFLFVGAGYIAVLAGLNTVVQLRAPAEARGRILSIYMMGLGIVYPIGAAIQGQVANTVGVRAVTVAGAALLMACMVAIVTFRPGILAALGDLPSEPPAERTTVLPTAELP